MIKSHTKKKSFEKDIKLHIQNIMVPTKNRGIENFQAKKAYTKQYFSHKWVK